MSQILGLKFRDHGQVYYFSSGAFVVKIDDHVLVKTEQGFGLGKVVLIRDEAPQGLGPDEVKPIYRLANDEDLATHRENLALASDAFRHCRECIRSRELEMKLVDVEVYHDKGKMIFYFTAPGRIDFRELVKDLVKAYHTRIELRQIGVRHESQMLGAIGNCGQVCCCRRFMRRFAPVTIKMAKEQNLFLNPTKISGICGRLLCCLNFEQENYEQFQKKCPKPGKRINTSLGPVKILRTNLFRETITFFTENGEEQEVGVDRWREILAAPPREDAPAEDRRQPRPDRPNGSQNRPQAESQPRTEAGAQDDDEDRRHRRSRRPQKKRPPQKGDRPRKPRQPRPKE